jgi:DNA-binding transcriptional regulator YiaG
MVAQSTISVMPSTRPTDRAVALALVRRLVADGTAKRIREAAHLSLSDVGRACGTSAASVWYWERGREPRPALGILYAEVLSRLSDEIGLGGGQSGPWLESA